MSGTTGNGPGSVVLLRRYPVKSMMGEDLNAVELSERGLVGDRAFALIDRATGKVASAKNPGKWSKLFDCHAAYVEPPRQGRKPPSVRISLPDGSTVTTDEGNLEKVLSGLFDREVMIASAAPEAPSLEEYWPDMDGLAHRDAVTDESMPAGTFFDLAAVHLLTTATIDRLRELCPQGRFEVRRFRPNIVVQPAPGDTGFVENTWVGRTLAIGSEVRLSVTGPCPRCVMTTLAQGDLPKDPAILRTAAQHNQVQVGVYASVLRGGTIRRGDAVRIE